MKSSQPDATSARLGHRQSRLSAIGLGTVLVVETRSHLDTVALSHNGSGFIDSEEAIVNRVKLRFGRAVRVGLRLTAMMSIAVLFGCASLPMHVTRTPSQAMTAAPTDRLVRTARASAGDGDSFRPLPSSDFSMDARLTLAHLAQSSLDLQYYLIQNDVTGRSLMRSVRDAAMRGVRVRILVDDLYTASSDRMLQGLSAYPNVEVRVFNPFPAGRSFTATRFLFSAFDFVRINHRMHNKLFIADGAFAIAGGRNIADEYFFRSKEGNFLDFDVLLAGPSVVSLEHFFDEYWNSRWSYPLTALEPPNGDLARAQAEFENLTGADPPLSLPGKDDIDAFSGFHALSADIETPPITLLRGGIRVFADNPEKVSGRSDSGDDPMTVTAQVLSAFGTARTSLLLVSPYFVPSENAVRDIGTLRSEGISVDIVTNSMAANDEPFVSAAYARYRPALLRMGVGLYEISSPELKTSERFRRELGSTIGRSHAKLAVIDDRVVFVGSMNLDLRSSRLNTEVGLLIDSTEFANGVTKVVAIVRANGCYRLRLVEPGGHIEWIGEQGDHDVYTSDPQVDFGTRIELDLLSPLIPGELL
jgi:putative cardiolipin synthase